MDLYRIRPVLLPGRNEVHPSAGDGTAVLLKDKLPIYQLQSAVFARVAGIIELREIGYTSLNIGAGIRRAVAIDIGCVLNVDSVPALDRLAGIGFDSRFVGAIRAEHCPSGGVKPYVIPHSFK